MLMAYMTWHEVKKHISEVNDNLIIPVATCEQHGYHLPLGNDTFIAEYMAGILSQRTKALVAPTMNYGVNLPCDVHLAGTTSIKPETLREMIISITDWWRQQGFRHFLLLTYHGDPFHLQAMKDISDDIKLYDLSEIEYSDILERQASIRHACEAETSVALYLYPEKVKMESVREHDIPFDDFRKYLFHEAGDLPEGYVGSLGYPSFATKDKGSRIIARMIDRMIDECYDFLKP
ncbi:MAG TPA: creatininase family protein [Candidatus Atribacteria bacterium]|nr:creatininase family protein [Candidatus Atribacteria bacterium]HPT78590.1 creatininase family protein [Candidatus Atribacteria bacterium]